MKGVVIKNELSEVRILTTKVNSSGLTRKQMNMAERLANPDFVGTVTELCDECGVSRTTFYKWMDKKAFNSYLSDQIAKYSDSELSRVWKALIKKIEQGDVQAMKLYFDQRDKMVTIENEEDDDSFINALEKKASETEWE